MIPARLRLVLGVEMLAIGALLVLALDVLAHRRVEELGGVNVWGYRSAVAHQRQPREIRVTIVGGTRAFAWGQGGAALAAEVRRQILLSTDRPGRPLRPVVVINLGRLGATADSYPATVEHFGYLQPDYICLYDDLGVPGGEDEHDSSAIYERTGYAPALPLVLREKGLVWQYGSVTRGYQADRDRRSGDVPALRRVAGSAVYRLGQGLAELDRPAPSRDHSISRRLDPGATAYADAMSSALDVARRHAQGIVVATSPAETAAQRDRLRALQNRLPAAGSPAAWLRVVDFSNEPLLGDPAERIDGWNYGGAGTTVVAARLAAALLTLIPSS